MNSHCKLYTVPLSQVHSINSSPRKKPKRLPRSMDQLLKYHSRSAWWSWRWRLLSVAKHLAAWICAIDLGAYIVLTRWKRMCNPLWELSRLLPYHLEEQAWIMSKSAIGERRMSLPPIENANTTLARLRSEQTSPRIVRPHVWRSLPHGTIRSNVVHDGKTAWVPAESTTCPPSWSRKEI